MSLRSNRRRDRTRKRLRRSLGPRAWRTYLASEARTREAKRAAIEKRAAEARAEQERLAHLSEAERERLARKHQLDAQIADEIVRVKAQKRWEDEQHQRRVREAADLPMTAVEWSPSSWAGLTMEAPHDADRVRVPHRGD